MARLVKEIDFEEWEIEKGLTKIDLDIFGDFEAQSLRIYSNGTTYLYGIWYPVPYTVTQWGLPEDTEYVYAEIYCDTDLDANEIEYASEIVEAHWNSWDITMPGGEIWDAFDEEIAENSKVWPLQPNGFSSRSLREEGKK